MGAVYRAHDPKLGRDVAVKVVFREYANDPLFIERFAKEQASAALDHPHVVRVHRGGVEQGIPFLVMELLPGGSLNDRLKREGRLPWQEAARLGSQVASALAAVHAARLVHRDLKPRERPHRRGGERQARRLRRRARRVEPAHEDGRAPRDAAVHGPRAGRGRQARRLARGPLQPRRAHVRAPRRAAAVRRSGLRRDRQEARRGPDLDELRGRRTSRARSTVSCSSSSSATPARRPESAAAVAKKLDAIARGKLEDEGRGRGVLPALAVAAVLIASGAVAAVFLNTGARRSTPPPPPPPPVVVAEKVELVVDEPKDGALVAGEKVTVKGRARGATSLEVAGRPSRSGRRRLRDAGERHERRDGRSRSSPSRASKKDEKKRTVYKPPAWFLDLGAGDRPPLPLPAGLGFGANKGEYVNKKDESVLVWAPRRAVHHGRARTRTSARGPAPRSSSRTRSSSRATSSGSSRCRSRSSSATRRRRAPRRRSSARTRGKRIVGLNFWIYEGHPRLLARGGPRHLLEIPPTPRARRRGGPDASGDARDRPRTWTATASGRASSSRPRRSGSAPPRGTPHEQAKPLSVGRRCSRRRRATSRRPISDRRPQQRRPARRRSPTVRGATRRARSPSTRTRSAPRRSARSTWRATSPSGAGTGSTRASTPSARTRSREGPVAPARDERGTRAARASRRTLRLDALRGRRAAAVLPRDHLPAAVGRDRVPCLPRARGIATNP